MIKSFHEFLNEQDAGDFAVPSQGQMPQQTQMPQQGQFSQQSDRKAVFDAYRNMIDSTQRGFKSVSDFMKNHPKRNEMDKSGATGKIALIFNRINNDIKQSEALLRPLLEIEL